MGPVAPWHVGSSQTRARTHVPCIGRQILNHCTTREAPKRHFGVASLAPLQLELHSFIIFLSGNWHGQFLTKGGASGHAKEWVRKAQTFINTLSSLPLPTSLLIKHWISSKTLQLQFQGKFPKSSQPSSNQITAPIPCGIRILEERARGCRQWANVSPNWSTRVPSLGWDPLSQSGKFFFQSD